MAHITRVFAIAAAVFASASPIPAVCTNFATAVSYSTGNNPYSVALGDFNRDGKLDLATANLNGGSVTVRLGGNYGAFGSPSALTAGSLPIFVIAADLNRDGKLDLAVANNGSANVSIFAGNGDGTFAAATSVSTGLGPFAVAAADLNRDGKLDLVVPNFNDNNVSILIGDGAGGFTAGTPLAATAPVAVATGDFNRDGTIDLAVPKFNSSATAVFLNNGSASFSSGNDLTGGSGPRSVAGGDFNRDGRVDLAVANQNAGTVSVFLASGNGTFANATTSTVGTQPRSIVAADLNGDGRTDLAVANTGSNSASVLTGNGDGTFASAFSVTAGTAPRGIAAGVLHGDEPIDLVVANDSAHTVTVHLNASSCTTNCGTYGSALSVTTGSTPKRPATGDFNRDGKLDLAVPNRGANNLAILPGNGDGTFGAATLLTTGSAPESVAGGDFNRDGRLDLAVVHSGTTTVTIFLGNGDGTFPGTQSATLNGNGLDVAAADFNRDGKLDLIATQSGVGAAGLLLGNGNGTFAAVTNASITATAAQGIVTGDFNKDGKADFATANGGHGTISIVTGNGDGTFNAVNLHNVGGTARDLVVADLNRDGSPDLAVSRASITLVFAVNNGQGGFALDSASLSGEPNGLAVVDPASASTSLVTAFATTNLVARLIISAAPVGVDTTETYAVGTTPESVVAGDFNRDGRDDIVTSNAGSQNVSILKNYCRADVLLTSSANPRNAGEFVTFTAEVAGASALIGPTGTVTFRDDATVLVTSNVSSFDYTAGFSTSALTIGTHPITATYNGDFIFAPGTSTTLVQTIALAPPLGVYALPPNVAFDVVHIASNYIQVGWYVVPGADSYEVLRSSNNSAFATVGTPTGPSFIDNLVSPGVTYVYKVRTIDNAQSSALSIPAAATILSFTDDPLVAQSTVIKLVHLTELRSAVNIFRASAGLMPINFSEPTPSIIKGFHVLELESALSQAFQTFGWTPHAPTPILPPGGGTIVKRNELERLRLFIRSSPYGGSSSN